ncbi:sigma factor [Saccharomonospora halophila]|uniref:sigma factor n=1 Tax=Saccharomonospora halophila TaxID=129922 RepID=UPI0038CD3217
MSRSALIMALAELPGSEREELSAVDRTEIFEAERQRLVGIATRVLADRAEAEDVVQQAWLRLHRTSTDLESLPAWLTTVTTRLCLDRLRSRTPVPTAEIEVAEVAPDVANEVSLVDSVGVAMQVVLNRLSPRERSRSCCTTAVSLSLTASSSASRSARSRRCSRGCRDAREATTRLIAQPVTLAVCRSSIRWRPTQPDHSIGRRRP